MHTFVPFKRLGMVYLQGSPSHEAGIIQIRHLAQELGFDLISEGFPLRNKDQVPYPEEQIRMRLEQALEKVCSKADAFFVQTSTTFTKEFASFLSAFKKHHIISAGDPANIHKGLIMGIGKNAYRFGEQCAQYAIRILEGTAPADLPIDVGKKLNIQINLAAAKLVGYDPPFELVSAADDIFHEIESVNSQ
jgi:putative ABC transport system substrate-binding protein